MGVRSPEVEVLEHRVTMEKKQKIIATSMAVVGIRDDMLW